MAARISFACQQHILHRAAPLFQPQRRPLEPHPSPALARCRGSMAPSLGSQRLTCFYCGRRSGTRQDGTIREWKCGNCEAVNYLDQNGEITDPPIAIVEGASSTTQWAERHPRGESPSSSTSDNTLFCNDCLKNQHLVRSSLAQYVPEERETIAVDRNYLKFKESLELRYPQVCEDCLHGVIERLKQSSYTAKTDHLRRLLDKTRRSGTIRKAQKTWLDTFQILGLVLWRLGIYGQLAWNIAVGSVLLRQRLLDFFDYDQPVLDPEIPSSAEFPLLTILGLWTGHLLQSLDAFGPPLDFLSHCGISVNNMAKWSLLLSFTSLWWNPKFKEGYRGYHRHIQGFYDWYRYQALLIVARVLFWYVMDYDIFNRGGSPAALGAHIFMFLFTISVVAAAQKCIKVDFGPLFAPTSPERLLPYVGRKDKSKYDGQDMSQALMSILEDTSPSRPNSSLARDTDPFYDGTITPSSSQGRRVMSNNSFDRSSPPYGSSKRQSQSSGARSGLGMALTVPSLSQMTEDESFHYLVSGEIPAHMQGEIEPEDSPDAMEWNSEGSQYRAFQPARAPRQSQLFSQAPVKPDTSPFWYKGLPQAPVSQAHKARNPPNAPRLQPASAEAKTNFFNRLTGNQPTSTQRDSGIVPLRIEPPSVQSRREVEFAQQRFFPPSPKDAANGLSEMFEQAFTLKSNENENQQVARGASVPVQQGRRRHIFTALVLIVAWLAWNYSFMNLEFSAMGAPLGVMGICAAIAIRSITDWIQPSHSKGALSPTNAAGAFLGLVQTIAAAYAISEILVGRLYCDACQTRGSVLIGIMVLEEICFVASS